MKSCDYRVDKMDVAAGRLWLTCFNDDLPEGVAFSGDIPTRPPYPEGEAVDKAILAATPRSEFEAAARKRGNAVEEAPEPPPPALNAASPAFAMKFVVENSEKIFLLKALPLIRRQSIPLEIR